MRITAFLLLAASLQTVARGDAQTITLSEKNAPIQKVFRDIRRQTGFQFFYEGELLSQVGPITLDVKNAPLDKVLAKCFEKLPISFTISGKAIVVRAKEKPVAPPAVPEPPADKPPGEIHGRVTDSLGTPLAGASVSVKGSKKGTQTDVTGGFELKGVETEVTLVISFTGYTTREYKVRGETALIMLSRSVSPLDEIKVIAYGQTTQRLEVGNVTTVKAADIEKQPVSNPLLALEGMVPGLFITQASGAPGSGVTVQIQGRNSIEKGLDPFYVVDGVPYPSELMPNLGNIVGFSGNTNSVAAGHPMNFINPSDIESISVLKDADATAIYGSRGANGVILITTKRGKAGKERIDVNLQNGWSNVARRMKLMDGHQYLQMRREALKNDGLTPSATDYDLNGLWDSTRSTDWQQTLAGNAAQYTNLHASVSGGNVNTQYMVAGTYNRQTTIFPGGLSDQKGTVYFNISNASSNQRFHIQLSGSYQGDNSRLINDDPSALALAYAPSDPALYNKDGSLNWQPNAAGVSSWINPLAYLENKYHNGTDNLVGSANISYQILPGWEIKSSLGYSDLGSTETVFFPLTGLRPERRASSQPYAQYGYNKITTYNIEPQTSYRRKFGKSTLEALAGTTITQTHSSAQQYFAYGYNSDQELGNVAAAGSLSANSNIYLYKYGAAFTRINYNWDEKYILDLTARRDGSSRFGPANHLHDFGAIAAGWIFAQEKFFREKLSFISFGKLNASYGSTGSDQIGDYAFLNPYYPVTPGVPYQGATGLTPGGIPNPYLQWEETRKLSTGLDMGFIKDRILLKTVWYRDRSSNELIGYSLPVVAGFGAVEENFPAKIQNSGWEFTLSTTNIRSQNFSWTTNFNISISRNKLVAFPGLTSSSYFGNVIIGKPISILQVYHFGGVDPATGVYQFEDHSGHMTTTPDYFSDRTRQVDLTPRYFGGLTNTFRYKGLELSFLLQFVKQLGANYYFGRFGAGVINNNEPPNLLKRWQKPGDITTIQRFTSGYGLITPYFNAAGSDASFSDASYIRLKNLSLSWQLPDNWMKKARMQTARIYVQGQNLLTFTHFIGIDPENQSTNAVASSPLRTLTAGVQFSW